MTALALVCLGAAGCAEEPEPLCNHGDDLVIGALLPFTGEFAAVAINIRRTLDWVAGRFNDAGGLAGGKKVCFEYANSHSDPAKAMLAFERMLADYSPVALVGPQSAEVAAALMPRLAQEKLATISGSIDLPHDQDFYGKSGQYFFSIGHSPQAQADVLARRIVDDGHQDVAIYRSADSYSTSFAASLKQRFEFRGGVVDAEVTLPPNQASFGKLISDSLPTGTDAVALLGPVGVATWFINDFSGLGLNRPLYLGPTSKKEIFIDNVMPGALEGAVGVSPGLPATASTFVRQFREQTGEPPLTESFFYYDAAALLGLSIQAAYKRGTPTPSYLEQFRDWILRVSSSSFGRAVAWSYLKGGLDLLEIGEEINYGGASGGVDLDINGVIGSGLVRLWAVEGGEIVDKELRIPQL